MAIKVGINGFGRIGRNVVWAAKEAGADLDFVAGSDPAFGSGPLATIIQDLLSIAVYLAIAVPLAT